MGMSQYDDEIEDNRVACRIGWQRIERMAMEVIDYKFR
jgi:hypothetical protein